MPFWSPASPVQEWVREHLVHLSTEQVAKMEGDRYAWGGEVKFSSVSISKRGGLFVSSNIKWFDKLVLCGQTLGR